VENATDALIALQEHAIPTNALDVGSKEKVPAMASAQVKRQEAKVPALEPFRTLRGWAIGILLETQAISECEEHGHMRDRTDPDAWKRAREIASRYPFRGATPAEAVQALNDVMESIGDTCPECK
jgi:hypothetical protein